jgi:hypothetical protein
MSTDSTSSRRTFLKGGALLAAPITAASVSAVALADNARGSNDLQARLARLQDEAEIRELQHSWLRQVNAGEGKELPDVTVRRITVDHAGAAESIEIAPDGRSAVGTFDYAVELETPLALNSTLEQMAHAQGYGTVRWTGRGTLTVGYTKASGAWRIGDVAFRR